MEQLVFKTDLKWPVLLVQRLFITKIGLSTSTVIYIEFSKFWSIKFSKFTSAWADASEIYSKSI